MEIKVRSFTSFIIFAIMGLMLYSNYGIKGNTMGLNPNTNVLIVTGSICIVNLIYTVYSASSDNINKDNIHLLLLGIFSIASIGYTIYEWDTIKDKKDCSSVIPTSNKFTSMDYYIYRIIYLMTLIVLIIVLQFKVDEKGFGSKITGDKRKYIHYLLFLLPFIMPALTESITWFMNLLSSDKVNPESLLLNFIKGDAKKGIGDSWSRSIMPILFFIILMGLAIASSMGKIGTDGGETAIYIIASFLIFFSLIMKTLFIQDCSLEEDKVVGEKDNNSFTCSIEKYGGIQTMLNVCLIIIIIYHIDKPSYKLLFFTIILLASWALSSTYMLNLSERSDTEE